MAYLVRAPAGISDHGTDKGHSPWPSQGSSKILRWDLQANGITVRDNFFVDLNPILCKSPSFDVLSLQVAETQ
jgi:hypothetical protein